MRSAKDTSTLEKLKLRDEEFEHIDMLFLLVYLYSKDEDLFHYLVLLLPLEKPLDIGCGETSSIS
jgi:hypothetical protein